MTVVWCEACEQYEKAYSGCTSEGLTTPALQGESMRMIYPGMLAANWELARRG